VKLSARWKIRLAFWAAVLAYLMAGCQEARPTGGKPLESPVTGTHLVWGKSIGAGVEFWEAEASNRFKKPYVFVCHGSKSAPHNGVWVCVPDEGIKTYGKTSDENEYYESPRPDSNEDTVAWVLHDLMPDRDIVFISCNPNKLKITAPRVWYYPNGSVWSYPWWAANRKAPPGVADSIYQFVEGKPQK
jgi:hypothetical protein